VTTILCHPGRPSSAVFRQNFDLFVSSNEVPTAYALVLQISLILSITLCNVLA
jgi:hypothetical protein